jgi:hypothetical protein
MSKFGKFITMATATGQVKEYLRIRDHEETQKALTAIPVRKIREYYLDRELSFIFSKDLLNQLFALDDCNGVRVYYAAHSSSEAEPETETDPGGGDLADEPGLGAPTLVVVPCHINEDETVVTNISPTNPALTGACEHPGFVRYKGNPEDFDCEADDYFS